MVLRAGIDVALIIYRTPRPFRSRKVLPGQTQCTSAAEPVSKLLRRCVCRPRRQYGSLSAAFNDPEIGFS